jgi:hypothetical protein
MSVRVRVLSDEEVWSLMVSEIGFRRSVRLLGWCAFWSFSGTRRLVDATGGEEGSLRMSAYRALADLRRVVSAVGRAEGGDSGRVALGALREFAERVRGFSASRRASGGVLALS